MGVKQMHEDFSGAVERVRNVPYDIIDVGAIQFEVWQIIGGKKR